MAIRNRLRKRRQAEPDPRTLSTLALGARGVLPLGQVRSSDAPPDLLGVDGTGLPVLVAVLGPEATPGECLGVFVYLLGRDDLAAHVRRGCRLEVHRWSRRGQGWAVDAVEISARDYGAAEGERREP
jgi:hypothetical protein